MAGKVAWGIDIGQCGLRAVKLEGGGPHLQVSDFETIEYSQSLSDLPAASHDQTIRQALAEFASRHSLKGATVVAGVPGRNSQARFVALPPVEAKKIPQIVEFEAKQQIPFDIDDVVWDYQAIKLEDSPDVIAGIFFIKRDVVENFLANFQDAGIATDQVQMAPMALYNAMVFDGLTDPAVPTAILDVGSANTEFIVADGQKIFHRTIPIGGNNFTQTLVKTFKLSFTKAENLKRKCSTSKYAKQVFQAMRSVFSDLSSEVQRSIGFYTTLNRQAKIGRILAMGNTFRLPGLQKYLQQSLKVELVRVDQFSRLTLGPRVNAPAFSAGVLGMGVAYGLALQGLGLASVKTDLLPPSIGRQQMWQAKKPVFAVAAGLLALIVAGLFGRVLADLAVLKPPLDRKNPDSAIRIVEEGEKYKSLLADVNAQIDTDRQKIREYIELMAHRDVWPAVVQGIAKALQTSAKPAGEYAKPRPQRRLVFLQNLSSLYCEDVDKEYTEKFEQEESKTSKTRSSTSSSISGGSTSSRTQSKPKTGFIVEIRAITPFQSDLQYQRTSDFLTGTLTHQLPLQVQAELAKAAESREELDKIAKLKVAVSFSEPSLYQLDSVKAAAPAKSTRSSARGGAGRDETAEDRFPDRVRSGESMADDSYFLVHWKIYIEQEGTKAKSAGYSSFGGRGF